MKRNLLALALLLAAAAPSTATSLIATGSVWKYLDNGTDQGTAWKETNFNDSAWASGPAQLGYGDGDEATVVSYGPSSTSKYTTTYFRRSFNVPDTSFITNLAVRLLRDDGAVVYLNGVEVWRNNMPSGAIGYQTFATIAISGADETNYFNSRIPVLLLRPGTNVLAVEIHQSDLTSSDISFDLELVANSGLFRTVDPLPAPWIGLDIGGPGISGGAMYVTNSPIWMAQGSGADIGGTNDQLHYVYQTISGDWDMQARVASMRYTTDWSKAGLMMRESLAGSARQVYVGLSPTHGVDFLYRSATGGSTVSQGQTGWSVPYWVRAVRLGNTFTGYCSSNGVDWAQVYSVTVSMSNPIYVGLAVCAANNARACMAAFDHVTGLASAPSHVDIGSPALPGSVFMETNAPTFLMQGGGADIWNAVDEFHFEFQTVSGNCALQARVAAMGRTGAKPKAGVMMRESLGSSSRHVLMELTPSMGAEFLCRSNTAGNMTSVTNPTAVPPYWVRLVRAGNRFTGFMSADGLSWTQVSSADLDFPDTFFAGLALCPQENSIATVAALDSVDFLPMITAITAVDGDLFFQGDPIELRAEVAGGAGRVTQVRYYTQGSNFIGAATVPPYAFVWTNAPPGLSYVSARAVDAQGSLGEAASLVIFVAPADTHAWLYPHFTSSGGLILQGDAIVTNNLLRVSQASANSVGGAWLPRQPYVVRGFETTFQFQINSTYGGGADGFAFVIEGGTGPSVGPAGGNIGYGEVTNNIAIEFDTYQNSPIGDPNDHHISIHTRGVLANNQNENNSLGSVSSIPDFSDGVVHTAKIVYTGTSLGIYLDDLNTPVLTIALSLTNTINLPDGSAWVGFTAGSGGYYENHDILSWAFVTTNLHPVVSVSAPTNGAVFQPTDTIVLRAAATDADGTIQTVSYYMDGAYLDTTAQSPWQLQLPGVPAGPHTLTAIAADDTYAWTQSAPVTIMVEVPPSLAVPAEKTNGLFHVRFAGTPAGTYTIMSAPTVNGPWNAFTNLTLGTNGRFDLFDATVATQRFYRARMP